MSKFKTHGKRQIIVAVVMLLAATYAAAFLLTAKLFTGTRSSVQQEPPLLIYGDGESRAGNTVYFLAFSPIIVPAELVGVIGYLDDAEGLPNEQTTLAEHWWPTEGE